jgi:hypothetical protein
MGAPFMYSGARRFLLLPADHAVVITGGFAMVSRAHRLLSVRFCSTIIFAFLCFSLPISAQKLTDTEVRDLKTCNVSKTNATCKLVIDRSNPLNPPTIQMYSDQMVVVIIKNPLPVERYFLDDGATGAATVNPDQISAVVQGLFPAAAKVESGQVAFLAMAKIKPGACKAPELTDPNWPVNPGDIAATTVFEDCVAELAQQILAIYQNLEAYTMPDALTPNADLSAPAATLAQIKASIEAFLVPESVLSAKIAYLATLKKLNASDSAAVVRDVNFQKIADGYATDLLGYDQRINDLADGYKVAWHPCEYFRVLTKEEQKKGIAAACVRVISRQDSAGIYNGMVTRTKVYTLDTMNLVVNAQEGNPDATKKKTTATVTLNFADDPKKPSALRLEASAGVFFSTLPVRSFSVAPSFNGTVVTDNTVAQNIIHPTAVPFAAGNYRLTNDLKWSKWKSNIFWTGAIGINPNTVSADFATGPSLSWRALMISALAHFGHDQKLTQGFTVGESLGPTFSGKLPSKSYWTESFAIGISVRIPALTGR